MLFAACVDRLQKTKDSKVWVVLEVTGQHITLQTFCICQRRDTGPIAGNRWECPKVNHIRFAREEEPATLRGRNALYKLPPDEVVVTSSEQLRGGAEVARLAHNQEVGGSNPSPATNQLRRIVILHSMSEIVVLVSKHGSRNRSEVWRSGRKITGYNVQQYHVRVLSRPTALGW